MGAVRLLLITVLCLGLAGCHMTRHEADLSARAAMMSEAKPVDAAAWPVRRTDGLPQLVNFRVIRATMEDPAGGPPLAAAFTWRWTCTPVGQGWIVERGGTWTDEPGRAPAVSSFEYCGWSRSEATAALALPAGEHKDDALNDRIEEAMATANMRVGFQVESAQDGPSEGVVLFCPGLAGGKYQYPVVKALIRRGWTALGFVNLTSRPYGELSEEEYADLRARATTVSDRDLEDRSLAERCTAAAVSTTGDFIADLAYAYEAALVYLEQRSPQLKGKPVVIVGCSLGAIITPTLAARLGDRVEAAVLIGGGADFCSILPTSGLLNDPLLLWTEGGPVLLTETLAERVRDDYLARSTVDPYATAPLLASRPVLVVQAERDGIVRREFGDLLWERLGRPERWMGNYGHLLLIYFLSDHAEEIADWVEAAVPRKKG